MIYFDYNSTSPVMPQAREAWLEATEHIFGNPSSAHDFGARAAAALRGARQRLAAFLGCKAEEIVWTSGATEANNTVMHHFWRTLDPGSEVWISGMEHPCVMESAQFYFGKRLRLIPVTLDGVIDLEWLTMELSDRRPGLIGVMAANNETGVIQPWREIQAICRGYGAPFFTDAVQWLGKMPARGLGDCDYVSGAAHKFGGPRGVGFLKVPSQKRMTPLLLGGKQERGLRAGTENVAMIVSMMAGLEAREKQIAENQHLPRGAWRDNFEREVLRAAPDAIIVGGKSPRLWNTVSVLMPEGDQRNLWVIRLDEAGFAVSTGSACSTGRQEPSHALAAMGYQPTQAIRAVRISAGWETTESDWQALAKALAQAYENMK